jgi:hypothetical protein
VIGRTTILTNSTNLKKETKYQGELEGNNLEIVIIFIVKIITLLSHNKKAAVRLKDSVVVTG